jgi:hypothetical protein
MEMQIGTKVHQQEPVISTLSEKSQDKCLMPKDGTVYPADTLPAKHCIFASQP